MDEKYREELICFFEQAREKAKKDYYREISDSVENTTVYEKNIFLDSCEHKKSKVIIKEGSSVDTASLYSGKKIAILNFASAYRPGGGVTTGAIAQEETLCRCSFLYEILSSKKCVENYYKKNRKDNLKFGSNRIIYSPDIVFFYTDKFNIPKEIPPFRADIITCAAPNLRNIECNPEELKKILIGRYDNIFKSAYLHGCEILILGAIGCGVFKNPVSIVAQVMKDLCEKYTIFEEVVFPIYKSTKTLETFKNIFYK